MDSDDAVQARGAVPAESASAEQLLYVDGILRITCAVMAGPSVVRLVGEVDATNSNALRRTLVQARQIDHYLVVDAGRIAFIDVSGVRELSAFVQESQTRVQNVPSQMRRLLHMLRLAL
ncbi:STAS domain-containing protein [Nonomuraea sp. NPDC048916]|uniref:STAS domain-containing protein n=1 Tax=Nonomuraea sp. NPDC048916 TaxID=3154232 RepID=UPI0033C13FD7